MPEKSKPEKKPWLGSITAKVVGATALVMAVVALVNGAMDLYNAIAKVPTNKYDKTNDALFRKHFGKSPLLKQPFNIQSASATVEMLLEVYETGDIFVRYGDFQQWLPFPPLRMGDSSSIISEAYAQAPGGSPSPVTTPRVLQPININIESLKTQEPGRGTLGQATIERSFVVAKMKEDHQLFSSSTGMFEETFAAEPGYKISSFEFQVGSAANYRIDCTELVNDGRALRVRFALTSGPAFNRYRGWIQGTVKTIQERIP